MFKSGSSTFSFQSPCLYEAHAITKIENIRKPWRLKPKAVACASGTGQGCLRSCYTVNLLDINEYL